MANAGKSGQDMPMGFKMEDELQRQKVQGYAFRKKKHQVWLQYEWDEEVKEEKDLGIWVEEDLRPTKQCKMAAQSANWALGQLSRAFHFRKASCLVPLYKTFVRPKLEYAVAAWSPWMEGNREVLEKVQRRWFRTKKETHMKHRSDVVGGKERKRRRHRNFQNNQRI